MRFVQRFQVSVANFLVIFALSASAFSPSYSFAQHGHHHHRSKKKSHHTQPTPPYSSILDTNPQAISPEDVPCLDDHGNVLGVNDEQVLLWKTTTQNQFLARAHIKGVVHDMYKNRNGHYHFQAVIGKRAGESIEVVYNSSFGKLPQLVPGMSVEACGDYITSNAPTPQYAPSPDGAIIHWVHRSYNVNKHKSGYVALNGKVYGMGSGK